MEVKILAVHSLKIMKVFICIYLWSGNVERQCIERLKDLTFAWDGAMISAISSFLVKPKWQGNPGNIQRLSTLTKP